MNRRSIETFIGASVLALGLSGASTGAEYGASTGADYEAPLPYPEAPQQKDIQPLTPSAPIGEPITQTPREPAMTDKASTRAISLRGRPVRNLQGEMLGEVDDLLVTSQGQVRALVLGRGGLWGVGMDRYEVPWSRVHLQDDGYLAVDIAKDEVKAEFSAFESEPPLAKEPVREQEQEQQQR